MVGNQKKVLVAKLLMTENGFWLPFEKTWTLDGEWNISVASEWIWKGGM